MLSSLVLASSLPPCHSSLSEPSKRVIAPFGGALAEGGAAAFGFLENGAFIEMNLTVSDRSGMGFVSLGGIVWWR